MSQQIRPPHPEPRPDPLARIHGTPTGRVSGTETHVLDYLAVFYRHRFVAASAFVLVLLASLLNTYTTTPMYRARPA